MNDALINSYIGYLNENNHNMYLSESILNIDLDRAKESYYKNIKAAENFLLDHGVSIKYIKSQAKKASDKIKKSFKNNVPASKAASDVIHTVGKETLITVLKGHHSKSIVGVADDDGDVLTNTFKSIMIFVAVVFVNQFLLLSVAIVGGPVLGAKGVIAILAIVLAPFVEEFSKRIAIKGNYGFLYTGIFSGLEFLLYVTRIVAMGGSLPIAILLRLSAVAMHFSTTYIQKKFINYDMHYDSQTGYFIAVGVHSVWNFVGLMFEEEFQELLEL